MRKSSLALIAAGSGLAMVLTACGANSTASSDGSSAAAANGPKIGVILPETATSARWADFDAPMLRKALTSAGLNPIIENAQGDNQKFSQYADSMLSQGVKVLIIAAPSGNVGATVEQKARQQGVPVIDYDRLNAGGSADYYVSFDNVRVGQLQGTALKDALAGKPGARVIEIEGSPTDNNATQFHDGQEQVLKPLYDAMGTRRHPGGRTDTAAIVAESLAEVGLPAGLAAAAQSDELDDALRASTADALALVGNDVGTPVVAIDGVGFFGPVVTPAPRGEKALAMFDGLALMTSVPGFYELKRSRTQGPVFDSPPEGAVA